MRATHRRFLRDFQPSARGGLHARLSKPALQNHLDKTVGRRRGKLEAIDVARVALETADLTPAAVAFAQKFLADHGGVTPPAQTRENQAFEQLILEAQDPDSPGGVRVLKTEVEQAFEARQGEDIPRVALRRALQTASLTQGAFTALQDYLRTGQLGRSGAYYATPPDFAIGDRFHWKPGGGDPIEVEVVSVETKPQRVRVDEKFGGRLGGTITLPSWRLAVRTTEGDQTFTLRLDQDEVTREDPRVGATAGEIVASDQGHYVRQKGVHPFSDKVHSSARLDQVNGETVLRVRGQVIRPGDAVRYQEYGNVEGQGHTEFDFWGRVRSIDTDKGGKPKVIVDEAVFPSGLRTRRLLSGELGLLDRMGDLSSMFDSYLRELPQMKVVPYPMEDSETSAIQINDQRFAPGDAVFFETSGRPKKAQLLTMTQGPRGPEVLARVSGGRVKRLTQRDLRKMRLDLYAQMSRNPHADPRPSFEVVRPERGQPFVLLGEAKAYPKDLVVFDRGSPGDVPMLIDRIERDRSKDVVWVTEPIPLAPDDGPKVKSTIDLGGHSVTVTHHDWPKGHPKHGQPAFALQTRPLGEHEYHLMKSEAKRRGDVKNSRDTGLRVRRQHNLERARYRALQAMNHTALNTLSDRDIEQYERRAFRMERPRGLGTFGIHGLGWALSRAHTYGPTQRDGKMSFLVRDVPREIGDGLRYRRGDEETQMRILDMAPDRIKVEALVGHKTEDRWLEKEDLVFLFPDDGAKTKLERRQQRAIARRMLAT